MLFEGFFDIIFQASGLVAGKNRQALAQHKPLFSKGFLPSSLNSKRLTPRPTSRRSHPALAKSVLCLQDEGAPFRAQLSVAPLKQRHRVDQG